MAVINNPDASSLLSWLREYPRVAAMILCLKNGDDFLSALEQINIESASTSELGMAIGKPDYDVKIQMTCLAPLTHGSDSKAGNATLFRRMQIISTTGAEVKRLLREVKSIGKKRAYGYGKIISVEVEPIDQDFSFVREGVAMRWLPSESGWRAIRASPPYWNNFGKVICCEVGELIR